MERADALWMSVDNEAERTVVWVGGELTAATGPRLLRTLDTVLASRSVREEFGSVLVDLEAVRGYDVEGIAALRHAQHAAHEDGLALRVTGLDGHWAALPRRIAAALRPVTDRVPVGV